MPTPEPLPSPVEAAPTQGAYFAGSRHSETSSTFVDLQPDGEYELQVRAKNDFREVPPSYRDRTSLPAVAAISSGFPSGDSPPPMIAVPTKKLVAFSGTPISP